QDCKKAKKELHVWTVNEEKYMRMLCENQVEAMITNYPDRGIEIAKEYRNGKILPELIRVLEREKAANE
ncbi:MAG: glycerophosphodiester phosphodiesterase family protein, partial [Roseburia sp.]|nr:glycerophosphodiester phosphodiesterase family protein [Roseburia sp.]